MIAALAVDMRVRVIGPDVHDRCLCGMTGRIEGVVGDLARVALFAWGGACVTFPMTSLMDDRLYVQHSAPKPATRAAVAQRTSPTLHTAPGALRGDSRASAADGGPLRWNAWGQNRQKTAYGRGK